MVLPPKTGRVWEGPKGERRCHNTVLPTSHNPSHWNSCWLRDAWATRKDPEIKYGSSKMTGQRQPGNNSMAISASGKSPTCQCRRLKRHGFNPWVRKIPWRRAQQPTPVFLPGESHGQRNLGGYSPQGSKELDTTEATQHQHHKTWDCEPGGRVVLGSLTSCSLPSCPFPIKSFALSARVFPWTIHF